MKPPPLRVTAALIEREGCYLAALRPFGDENGGLWEFPGGKIRPGETPEVCLKREIREELGIEIEVKDLYMTSRGGDLTRPIELMVYRVSWVGGDPKPREHAALRWIEPSQFHAIDWSPADVPVADRLYQEKRDTIS